MILFFGPTDAFPGGYCIPWNSTIQPNCVLPGTQPHSPRPYLIPIAEGTPVYLSPQYTIPTLQAQLERSIKGAAFFHESPECVVALVTLECSSAFRPCVVTENGNQCSPLVPFLEL